MPRISTYYAKLQQRAILHFKSIVIPPTMRTVNNLPYPIEIEHANVRDGGLQYSARADFGNGVVTPWYDIWFPDAQRDNFVLYGSRLSGMFFDERPLAYVDVFLLDVASYVNR